MIVVETRHIFVFSCCAVWRKYLSEFPCLFPVLFSSHTRSSQKQESLRHFEYQSESLWTTFGLWRMATGIYHVSIWSRDSMSGLHFCEKKNKMETKMWTELLAKDHTWFTDAFSKMFWKVKSTDVFSGFAMGMHLHCTCMSYTVILPFKRNYRWRVLVGLLTRWQNGLRVGGLKGQYRHDRSRLSTGHGIGVLV